MVKGTLVHSALEGLFWNHDRARTRTPEAARAALNEAWRAPGDDPEFDGLRLTGPGARRVPRRCRVSRRRLPPPRGPGRGHGVGVELLLEAEIGGLRLRGIIDRLDVTADGEFIVVGLQDRPDPEREAGAQPIGRRAVLRPAVRAGPRTATDERPAALPEGPGRHRGRACRTGPRAVCDSGPQRCGRPSSGRARTRTSDRSPPRCAAGVTFQAFCPAFGGDPAQASDPSVSRGRVRVASAVTWPVVDAIVERVALGGGRWRGRPVADALAYGASALGDHRPHLVPDRVGPRAVPGKTDLPPIMSPPTLGVRLR